MSAILDREHKVATSFNFSKFPEVQAWGLPALIPDAHSAGTPSVESNQSTSHLIDMEEPCFVTKSSCFTHERVRWVNAIRKDPITRAEVERLISEVMCIVRWPFSLDSRVNVSNMDRTLHSAFDKYGLFAITGSLDTLNRLICLLEEDISRRQDFYDGRGQDPGRYINLNDATLLNPQYELVALRPHHMLPDGKVLVAYTRNSDGRVVSYKMYVPGEDNTLREAPGTLECARFPPFSFDYPRPDRGELNPFLVILNAEIKFRRYLRQVQPPPLLLPPDVMNLMDLTTRVVQLLYWRPVIRPGTIAEEMFIGSGVQREEDEELNHCGNGEGVPRRPGGFSTLEERMEYGQYLLSGRDLDLDSDEEV